MDRKKKLLIADNYRLVADACKQILEPEFEVGGIVTDGRALVEAAIQHRPDLVILEVYLPLLNGLDAAAQIKRRLPSVKLIFATAISEPGIVADAFRRGASGYVLKQSGAEEFLTAIRRVMRGESHLSSLVARETIEHLLRQPKHNPAEKQITRRQAEILQLLAEGKSMKEVACLLEITPGTVAFHKYNMMEKLGIESNAALLHFAMQNCMTPAERHGMVVDRQPNAVVRAA